MSVDRKLLAMAIAEAKYERQMQKHVTTRVIVADTMKKAKAFGEGCQCDRCNTVTRRYSTSASLRGQVFDGISSFHVLTYDPVLWRDLLMCMHGAKTSGPIFVYLDDADPKRMVRDDHKK